MATIAEARPLPQEARGPLRVSRRWFVRAAAGSGIAAVVGGSLSMPEADTPRGEGAHTTMLRPGYLEAKVQAGLIEYPVSIGEDGTPSKGPTKFLGQAVSNVLIAHDLTPAVVRNQYEKIERGTFSSADSLEYASAMALAFLQKTNEKPDERFIGPLEAIRYAMIARTILATAPWFSSKQLSLYGFPVQSFYDLRAKNAVELYSQPGWTRHQIVAEFYALMYAYSVYFGLNKHIAIPGILRARMVANRLLGSYPSFLDEAIDFAVEVGRLYEYSTLGDSRNWPILNASDSLREGPFAQDADEDDKANRFGAEMGVRLLADAVSGRSLAEILERYNQAVGVAA